MRTSVRSLAGVCLAVTLVCEIHLVARKSTLDVSRLLDSYAAGRFDEAVRNVAGASEADQQQLRQQWRTGGRLWIDADSARKSHRLLAAAAFALETEHLRAERGQWSVPMAGVCATPQKEKEAKFPAGPCVLEWVVELFKERGEPDDAERAWYLAASALVGGVRDWRFLYRSTGLKEPLFRGLLVDALVRFPGDARLRLEQGMAAAARYAVTIDGGGNALSSGIITVEQLPQVAATRLRNRYDARADAIEIFSRLADDPGVGAEARLRLGYLYWATREPFPARTEMLAAANAAKDADLRYLTYFLLGWTSLLDNRADDAVREFQASLEARPHSQSSSLALAALELQRGDATRAYERTRASLAERPTDADPWRQFLYGHHSQLPQLIQALRAKVTQ